MQIEHNPNERRLTNAIWWVAWPFLALLWIWYFYFMPFQWHGIALGFLSGGFLTGWALEVTGNKVPDSWRRQGPTSGR